MDVVGWEWENEEEGAAGAVATHCFPEAGTNAAKPDASPQRFSSSGRSQSAGFFQAESAAQRLLVAEARKQKGRG